MQTKKAGVGEFFKNLTRQQIFIPLVALALLLIFNLIADPNFFKITLGHNSAGDPVLSGYLITILDSGSELAILAIGMTLVTAATGGQDISVGATTAIAGSVILRVLCGTDSRPDELQAPIIVAFLVAALVRICVGSATVAMTMAAGIVAAMPEIASLSPMYLACVVAAVAGGATVCSHFNDSGFWLVRSLIGLDEKTTLKTWTIMETLVGGTGFIVALIISFFV